MTQNEVIELAKQAEFSDREIQIAHDNFARFAALVEAAARADEREACAKLCESHVRQPSRLHFAAAIRARGTT
jgi:hypothetical protein